MTKRLAMTMSTIALAGTGALVPNAAFAGTDTARNSDFSVSRTDGGTSWKAHADRGTSWDSYATLRGTSWE